jgi:hypothetical protein
MVAMIVPVVGKRLHSVSVTENGWLFKQIARQNVANVSAHERSKTENRKCNLCLHFAMCCCDCSLVRAEQIARVEIPEVLIGEINFRVDH